MLGLRRSPRAWRFAAVGKHPAAPDFLSLGQGFSLSHSLAQWVAKGYACRPESAGGESLCWRFWLKGGISGEFVCGFLRESRDSIGRPFPLLILGQGPLPGWGEHWAVLTLACDGAWREMAAMAQMQGGTVPELEGRVRGLTPPRGDWEKLRLRVPGAGGGATPRGAFPGTGLESDEPASLPHDTPGDPEGELALRVARLCRECAPRRPSLGFLGGAPGSYRYLLFPRPLRGADFGMLWQPGSATTGTP